MQTENTVSKERASYLDGSDYSGHENGSRWPSVSVAEHRTLGIIDKYSPGYQYVVPFLPCLLTFFNLN